MADRHEEWGGHGGGCYPYVGPAPSPWLVTRQVPSERVTVIGFGARRPVASNDDASGRRQNRRVEVSFGGGEQ